MDAYVEGYGVAHRGSRLVALRFRRPIVRLRVSADALPVDTRNVLVVSQSPDVKPLSMRFDTLAFALQTPCSPETNARHVHSARPGALLLALLDEEHVQASAYQDGVLYVLGSRSLTPPVELRTVRKNATFRALVSLLTDPFSLPKAELCGRFRRRGAWGRWSSWWPLVRRTRHEDLMRMCRRGLSFRWASRLSRIWRRSQVLPQGPMPGKDWYRCEVLLTRHARLMGVMFNTDYVSPMIVSHDAFRNGRFRDVNGVTCERWLPLYVGRMTWLTEGMPYYLRDFDRCLRWLREVVEWLRPKEIDKYREMRWDLSAVLNLLT